VVGTMSACKACGAWWLPGSVQCHEHLGVGEKTPTHNLPDARRRFPALAEDMRKLYRINGNLASDNKEGE
jgi:hypothetical protein